MCFRLIAFYPENKRKIVVTGDVAPSSDRDIRIENFTRRHGPRQVKSGRGDAVPTSDRQVKALRGKLVSSQNTIESKYARSSLTARSFCQTSHATRSLARSGDLSRQREASFHSMRAPVRLTHAARTHRNPGGENNYRQPPSTSTQSPGQQSFMRGSFHPNIPCHSHNRAITPA